MKTRMTFLFCMGLVLLVNAVGIQPSFAQTYTILKSFGSPTNSNGNLPFAKLVQSPDGTLYGMTTGSGFEPDYGSVFRFRLDGSGFAILKTFTNYFEGASERGGLVLAGNTVYGTRSYGGTNGQGTLFKVNTDGSGFAVLKHFIAGDGATPYGCPIVVGETIYGTTYSGGASGQGVLYKVSTDGSGYTIIKHFGGSDGSQPFSGLTVLGDTLYGTTYGGGNNGAGTIFSTDINGVGYTVLRHFQHADGRPKTSLALSRGVLYGTTSDSVPGKVFKMNTNGSGFVVLKSFDGLTGTSPDSGVEIQGDTIFGTALYQDYTTTSGLIYKLYTDGSGYTVLRNFSGWDGRTPNPGVTVWGNTLYGATTYGGGANRGVLYKINMDGTGFTLLKELGGDNGLYPYGGLTKVGNTLYGTTERGGLKNGGTVFKINIDGTGHTVLRHFDIGQYPNGDLVLSGNTIYGITTSGSEEVFRVNTDGSGSSTLDTFGSAYFNPAIPAYTNNTGQAPSGGLVLIGNELFGVAQSGGHFGKGTIFKVNIGGGGITTLKHFTGSDGQNPVARLAVSGNTLYGTTQYGGTSSSGTLFKIESDGSGFTVLKNFTVDIAGFYPKGALTIAGDTIYGTTSTGDPRPGSVFKINKNGSGFTVLTRFENGMGGHMNSGVTLMGDTLYGVGTSGGLGGYGTLFKLRVDGSGQERILDFAPGLGYQTRSPVVVDGGIIYGTAGNGGPGNGGVIFKVTYAEGNEFGANSDACSTSGNVVINSNSTNSLLIVGFESVGGTNLEYRAAVRFPLPPTLDAMLIQSATLKLNYTNLPGIYPETSIRAHRILEPLPANGQVYALQHESAYTEALVNGNNPHWVSWDVTTAARQWAANPSSDFGFLLRADPTATNNGMFRFDSSESSLAYIPVLEITYRNPTQFVGTVTMQITPQASITNGAQWRLNGGQWLNSGTVVSNVIAGNHLVEFKPILEWKGPDPFTVRVVGNHSVSNQVSYLSDPLAGYFVGQIPTQYVYQAQQKVLKVKNPIGASAVSLNNVNPSPAGSYTYIPATGLFQYTPATSNDPTFHVTFLAQNGVSNIFQSVAFLSFTDSPPVSAAIGFPGAVPLASDEGGKYLQVTTATNSPTSFNNQVRSTRSITVIGKTVVFQSGHTNGLYDFFNENDDIKQFNIHAETLVVRSPLRLPQTEVTLYARELLFDGANARIETTPRSLTIRPAGATASTPATDGANGLKAGDMRVFIERMTNQQAGMTRFILKGGDGQPGGAGLSGAAGRSRTPLAIATNNFIQFDDFENECPNPSYTTAAHTYNRRYAYEPILGSSFLFDTQNYYFPHVEITPGGGIIINEGGSWLYDNQLVWQPDGGTNAISGGKPGDGGAAGEFNSNLRMIGSIMNPGGKSALATFNSGGQPGLPQPAYKMTHNRDEFYIPTPRVGAFWSATDDWFVTDIYVSQAGQNASSPRAENELGQSGGFAAVGHSFSWLTPYALRMVLTNATDACLAGHLDSADSMVAGYESLLTIYPTLPEWQQLSSSWQSDFDLLLQDIQALRQRIASHTFNLGSNAILTASTPGSPPLTYQWLFNGAAIAGATNESLTLTNLRLANQGNYSVIITNSYASVTSSVTALNLNLPPGYFQLKNELLGNGSVRLTFIGEPGQPYALDRSVTLFPLNWVGQITNVAEPAGAVVFTNAPDPNSMNFWRIRAVP